jgi:dihydroorotase
MTSKPAEAFGLPYGKLEVGADADLVVINLDEKRPVDPSEFLSKGKNTPFAGWELEGWPTLTFFKGTIVWEKGRVQI